LSASNSWPLFETLGYVLLLLLCQAFRQSFQLSLSRAHAVSGKAKFSQGCKFLDKNLTTMVESTFASVVRFAFVSSGAYRYGDKVWELIYHYDSSLFEQSIHMY